MKKITLVIIGLLCLLMSCDSNSPQPGDRSTDSQATENEVAIPPKNVDNSQTAREIGLISEQQHYSVNTAKETVVESSSGLTLYIPSNAFVDQAGNPVTGEVELQVRDFFDGFTIFSEPISTTTTDGMLATRGMIEIKALHAGEEVQLAEGKGIDLFFPNSVASYAGAEIFYGYENEDGVIEWERGSPEREGMANSTINWEKEIRLDIGVGYEYRLGEDPPEDGIFGNFAVRDSLQNWLKFTEQEMEVLRQEPAQVFWTLFSDGDLEVYHVRGNIPPALKTKLTDQLNALPQLPPFSRWGEDANVSGSFTFGASFVEPEFVNSFSLRARRLGWVNCDIFWRVEEPLVNMVIEAPNVTTIMKLVFKDYETIVSGVLKDDKTVHFTGIPQGAAVQVVALYPEDGKLNYSITDAFVQEELKQINAFEIISISDLEQRLNALIEI